jgi:hypothetical protein
MEIGENVRDLKRLRHQQKALKIAALADKAINFVHSTRLQPDWNQILSTCNII